MSNRKLPAGTVVNDTPAPERRRFLRDSARFGALALGSGCAGVAPAASARAPENSPVADASARAVPALKPGGTVAVIATASPAGAKAEQVAAWIKARGFVPRLLPSATIVSDDYLAGADMLRLHDLHDAFADSTIDAILCLRGGYGSARLLDRIDFDLIGRHPKPFVGYSDVTALLLALARNAGFVTFHGPMLASDLLPGKRPPTESALFDMLQGRRSAGSQLPHPPEFPLDTLHGGVAHGRLLGGNLAIIGSLLGTPYEIDLNGAILLIEDVGETPQKIDRLLTQLRLAGKLAQARGILIGDFSEIDDPRAAVDRSAADRRRLQLVWRDLLEPLGVPILAGWRSGHCDPNLTLPIGAMVQLDADRQQLRLEQDVVRRG